MIKNTTGILLMTVFLAGTFTFSSCKKEDNITGIDKELYDMARSTSGFSWYKYSSDLLDKSAGSGHNFPFLRTRYNATAASKLDSIGMIMADAMFPEGSLIVKELYDDANSLNRYAILYKSSNNASADANGWVWGYINADETVAVSATDKGKQCISCHSQQGSIDYMLMNKFFP